MRPPLFAPEQRVRVKPYLRVNGGAGGTIVERLSAGGTHHVAYRVKLDDGRTRDFFAAMLEPAERKETE